MLLQPGGGDKVSTTRSICDKNLHAIKGHQQHAIVVAPRLADRRKAPRPWLTNSLRVKAKHKPQAKLAQLFSFFSS